MLNLTGHLVTFTDICMSVNQKRPALAGQGGKDEHRRVAYSSRIGKTVKGSGQLGVSAHAARAGGDSACQNGQVCTVQLG